MSYWMHRHNVRYEVGRMKERMLIRIAWSLPRSVAYWAAIRVGAHATTGDYSDQVVPDLRFDEALKRWGN